MSIRVKVCGLNDEASVIAAVIGGADFIGFVFDDSSPSAITPLRAAELIHAIPPDVKKAGLFINPTDDQLRETLDQVSLDIIQCHGLETPARLCQIRHLTRRLVIKSIKSEAMFAKAYRFTDVADWLLFDIASWSTSNQSHDENLHFYWSRLKNYCCDLPWFLAGNINVDCLEDAVSTTQAYLIDVSSGVEDRPGYKNPEFIRDFLKLAKRLP